MKGIETGQRTPLSLPFASCFPSHQLQPIVIVVMVATPNCNRIRIQPTNQRVTRTLMNYGRQLANGHAHRLPFDLRDWPHKIEWRWPAEQHGWPIAIHLMASNVISQRRAHLLCEILEMLYCHDIQGVSNNTLVFVAKLFRLNVWLLLGSGWDYSRGFTACQFLRLI